MNYITVFKLLFTIIILNAQAYAQGTKIEFKKSAYYKVMTDGNEVGINQQLEVLQLSSIAEKEALEGALLMKKAGMVNGPKKKLNLFKEGHKKLETIIKKDSSNVEFRFLRLIIQEHSPGILGYKKELKKDSDYIRNNFKKLSPLVQQVAIDYSKTSKVLKL